ncbi:DUF3987 domain-containing protein, partial [Leptolyngbya sp. FACHB-711]|uniref:DUF3987 domain-containing protein n=1 Tax=Leptolyngbya sp. FACHB-711 TaxID=2692813 RepID=UPI001689942E
MNETNTKTIAVASSDRSEKTFSGNYPSSNPKPTPQQLLEAVKTLPEAWALVAVGANKAPLGKDWTKLPLTQADFEKAVQTGEFESLLVHPKEREAFHPPVAWWSAVGVLCGTPSGGLLFVDHDGASCDPLIEELSGQSVTEALPKTVAVTSGREGRYQMIYKVPEQFWGVLSNRKIFTGTKGEDGKPEQLEFRWDGSQSVMAGYHPTTGSYHWLAGQSPQECEVAEAPKWMIEKMLEAIPLHKPAPAEFSNRSDSHTWTDRDWALSYLAAIPPAEDYDTWLQVGMALHSVGEDLLADWDTWSRGASNYEPGVCETKWKSFKPAKGIGLGTLGALAKQHGWRSPFEGSRDDRPTITANQSNSVLHTAQPSAFELDEDFKELAQEVQSLVNLTEQSAPLQGLLSPHLTTPLTHRAKQFNVPLEAFVGILLPICAASLKIGTELEISSASDYRCPPILWTGLVGESGANKSPILDSLFRPLANLQAQADEFYQLELAQYEEALETWQNAPKGNRGQKPTPPVQREYYLQDTTLEAIASCLGLQPQLGIVISSDELAGLFNGFNQYRSGGRGNDRQKFLTVYNGGAIKVNRKSGNRISLAQTSISLTGTIQPIVLQKLMRDLDEVDGFWARFLWIPLPLTEMPPPGEGVRCDLFQLLRSLYEGLGALTPEIYKFDQRGQAIWHDWHVWCEKHKVSEPNSSLRAIYPKSKERAARIALVVHCMNAVVEGRVPDRVIPADLLAAAIAFTQWSIEQTRLIYADAGVVLHEDTSKIVRFIEKFRDRDWITARNVIHWWSGKPKPTADQARAFMKRVVDMGYAIDNGKTGREYEIRIEGNASNMGNNHAQSLAPSIIVPGNISGNSPVTTDNNTLEISDELSVEPSNNSILHQSFSASVTTDHDSFKTNDSRNSTGSSVELLPKLLPAVTSIVTNVNAAPGKESARICYPVTEAKIQVGDRVVLTGEGNSRPFDELKAVWTAKTIQEQKVAVECETLGRRVFPL